MILVITGIRTAQGIPRFLLTTSHLTRILSADSRVSEISRFFKNSRKLLPALFFTTAPASHLPSQPTQFTNIDLITVQKISEKNLWVSRGHFFNWTFVTIDSGICHNVVFYTVENTHFLSGTFLKLTPVQRTNIEINKYSWAKKNCIFILILSELFTFFSVEIISTNRPPVPHSRVGWSHRRLQKEFWYNKAKYSSLIGRNQPTQQCGTGGRLVDIQWH